MRDAGAERALRRAFGVDVDPLVIVGGVGKAVDAPLRHRRPLGVAQVGAHCGGDGGDRIEGAGHDRVLQARCALTETISPVM